MTLYVFGCFVRPGHHLWSVNQQLSQAAPYNVARACDAIGADPEPWRAGDDGQPEGEILRRYARQGAVAIPEGWSFVSWWDRKGDTRGNSHTGILAQGTWTDAELIAEGRRRAPWAFRVAVATG